MIYAKWLDYWLKNYVMLSAKPRTCTRYSEVVRVYLVPSLGGYDMDALTPAVMQRFVTGLTERGGKQGTGLSAGTVNVVVSVLQSSLKAAHAQGAAENYAAGAVKRPKVTERKVECFTAAEQKKIERSVLERGDHRMYGVVICLYTGLRIGELLALQWRDVDFRRGIISVERSCYDEAGGKVLDTPKTESSVRMIPLPIQLLPILREMKRKSECDFVVAHGKTSVPVRSYQRSFALLLARLGIPHRGFHSLRHTFATRALECGMDVRTLSELLGHKNPTVTLNRYAHSLMEHKRAMMNRLGKLL